MSCNHPLPLCLFLYLAEWCAEIKSVLFLVKLFLQQVKVLASPFKPKWFQWEADTMDPGSGHVTCSFGLAREPAAHQLVALFDFLPSCLAPPYPKNIIEGHQAFEREGCLRKMLCSQIESCFLWAKAVSTGTVSLMPVVSPPESGPIRDSLMSLSSTSTLPQE